MNLSDYMGGQCLWKFNSLGGGVKIKVPSSPSRYFFSGIALSVLTLCILMDFPKHIDKISIRLSIMHFKGSQVEFSKLRCFSVLVGYLNLSKQCRP